MADLHINDKFVFALEAVLTSEDLSQLRKHTRRIRIELEWQLHSVLELSKNQDTAELLTFFGQWFRFAALIDDGKLGKKAAVTEAFSRLAFHLASVLSSDENHQIEALELAKQGLDIIDCRDRYQSFNKLGRLAVSLFGKKQLAYDIYKSWIDLQPVGEVCHLLLDDFFAKRIQEEKLWRISSVGQQAMSVIYINFASVAMQIANTYELDEDYHKRFVEIAISAAKESSEIVKAIANTSQTKNDKRFCELGFYHSYNILGKAYSDLANNDYRHAIRAFETGKNKSPKREKGTFLLQLITARLREIVFQQSKILNNEIDYPNEKTSKKLRSEIGELYSLDGTTASAREQRTFEIRDALRGIYQFDISVRPYQEHAAQETIDKISFLLMLIYNSSSIIVEYLRIRSGTIDYNSRAVMGLSTFRGNRRKAKPIAYYTTIRTASYIFDELIQKTPGKAPEVVRETSGKNCLTVVHAKNMNDPHEGLSILNAFQKKMGQGSMILPQGSVIQFREDLYLDTYVFLKSFTEQIDKLVMWNRYASDYESDGKNSNGCCIEFSAEVFDRLNDPANNDIDSNDKSNLYRVVYLSDDYRIEQNKNTELVDYDSITHLFEFLMNTVKHLDLAVRSALNEIADPRNRTTFMNTVTAALRTSFQTIMFLFKDDDYSEEHESRLIFTRRYDQGDSIRVLPGCPQKLAINPYFQIFIKRIILGPNVRDPDAWKPYFQYQLNKMWGKYAMDSSTPVWQQYTVENSKIHYHT